MYDCAYFRFACPGTSIQKEGESGDIEREKEREKESGDRVRVRERERERVNGFKSISFHT